MSIAIQYVEGLCHINRGSVVDISIIRLELKVDLQSIMSAFSHQSDDSINNILVCMKELYKSGHVLLYIVYIKRFHTSH